MKRITSPNLTAHIVKKTVYKGWFNSPQDMYAIIQELYGNTRIRFGAQNKTAKSYNRESVLKRLEEVFTDTQSVLIEELITSQVRGKNIAYKIITYKDSKQEVYLLNFLVVKEKKSAYHEKR